jgi:hypothetical protein
MKSFAVSYVSTLMLDMFEVSGGLDKVTSLRSEAISKFVIVEIYRKLFG